MPQELQCVQCCQCNTFQSQIVKKVPKFTCALCNTKQSVRTIFARSTRGKDVREVVQRLNASRGRCEDAYDMASGAPDTHEQEELSREADPAGHDWLEFVAPDAVERNQELEAAERNPDPRYVTCLPDNAPQRKRRMQAVSPSAEGNGAGRSWQAASGTGFSRNTAQDSPGSLRREPVQPVSDAPPHSSCDSGRGLGNELFTVASSQPARTVRPMSEPFTVKHLAEQRLLGLQVQPSLEGQSDVASRGAMPLTDGVSSTAERRQRAVDAADVDWASWTVNSGAQQELAVQVAAASADITRQASAWLSPRQQRGFRQHAAMLVTTTD